MAKSLSKTGITTGNTVKAFHVTQSIDAFSGTDAYDIVLSGSLNINNAPVTNLTASGNISSSAASTASFGTYLGDGSQLTGISAGSSIDTGSLGSTTITGSLTVSGSNTFTNIGLFSQTGVSTFSGSLQALDQAFHLSASNLLIAEGFVSQSGTNTFAGVGENIFGANINLDANRSYKISGQSIAQWDGSNAIKIAETHAYPIQIGRSSLSNIELTGQITASGNISSSGNIIGVTGSLDHVKLGSATFLELYNPDDVPSTTSPIIKIATPFTDLFTLNTQGDAVFGSSIASSGGNLTLQNSGNTANLNVKGNITASGNISASSNINGNIINALQRVSTPVLRSPSNGLLIQPNQPQVTINGNITASSYQISSSFVGEITNVYRPITTLSTNPFTASNATAGAYYRAGGNVTCSIFVTASVHCTTGVEFEFIQTSSAGYVLFETGSGVTLNSKSNNLKLAGQFSAATLKYVGNNEWDLIGDLG